jgi:hypothetical protein
MKKRDLQSISNCVTIVILLTIFLPLNVNGQMRYLDDPVGARHMAMGASSAAMFSGPESVYHNPASLVWQTLTFGGGLQQVRPNQFPDSYWFYIYNSKSDMNMPMSMIIHGWKATNDKGDYRVNMIGTPIAYGWNEKMPAAATLKFAMEKQPSGKWVGGVPIDLGFLGRHSSGAVLGIVMHNWTIGPTPFNSIRECIDYGAAWGNGPLTISTTTTQYKNEKYSDFIKRYRIGVELGGGSLISLRGGYIKETDRWIGTGGIGLLSDPSGRIEFSYALVFDNKDKSFRHFVQYGYKI